METSTTGKEEYLQDVLGGLSPSLAQLREKLREKAKQEKKFQLCGVYSQLYQASGTDLLVNALNKGFDESRMREIRMSGLTREKATSRSKVYEY